MESQILEFRRTDAEGAFCYREELRELFSLESDTACSTAALLPNFHNVAASLEDGPLKSSLQTANITFVYQSVVKTEDIKDDL